jgi:hypothetical protein
MRFRIGVLASLFVLAGCGGGGGSTGPTKVRLLQTGDRWTYARTTTTIEGGNTTTAQADVTWRIVSVLFGFQNRLAIAYEPNDQAASNLVLRQDSFSRQVDIIGTVTASDGSEVVRDAVLYPGTLVLNASYPTFIVTPSDVVAAVATIGPQERVTVRAGSYMAHKVTITSTNVTLTQWIRPDLGAPVKQVLVETTPTRVRTIDWQLASSSIAD